MSNVLFVSAELAPFLKRSGVADVAAALPKALRGLGHKVTVVIPKTAAQGQDGQLGFQDAGVLLARRLTPLKFELGGETVQVTVYDGRLSSQVELCVLEWPDAQKVASLFEGDRARLAAGFCGAVTALVRSWAELGQQPDVVHLNDWSTAPIAAQLAELRTSSPQLASIKTVLTVHSLQEQGLFPRAAFDLLGLPESQFSMESFEFHGQCNFLKGGLKAADRVTTVSPAYAQAVLTSAQGAGLEGVLSSLAQPLLGIAHGVDYAVWNPATDSALAHRFDAENHGAKAICKGALVRQLLPSGEVDRPLLAFVGRFDAAKGFDTLLTVLPQLLTSTDAQVVLVGTGDAALVTKAEQLAAESMGRVVCTGVLDEADVRRVFAGADVVLVPSVFEPCGLVPMYAQRYGALPVAHAAGGINDTLVDCDAQLSTGTGFLYTSAEDGAAQGLLAATQRAIAALSSAQLPALRRRIMRLDRGWERAARQIDRVYQKLASS